MNTERMKTALVTGASRGLGAALAEALGARGFHIIAVARTTGGLEELDDRIRAAGDAAATLAPMDVTEPAAMMQLAGAIAQRWGGLDIWAHCAIHAAPLTPSGHVDGKDWTKSLDINATATQNLIGLTEPLLQARKGMAIIPDDPRGGQKFFGAYGASKAAQIALARSWQAETEKLGPRVLIPQPAPMPTATRARFFPGEDRSALSACKTEAEKILSEAGL
ncbi:SDR family NAD(P)-dependent oxidoreductase [Paracoccus aerodenitrificans]|uniref:SDR family NAD(P)-dependent oxidoreductase n=1 Tax=Paracoccus aerodenitrificans TaxID=3017781 RepID=UPI0022F0F329|nr:SDR family NAD(P)-dependent oxidoreductase [Paracoccus aerodenitrificans]WBU62634.1 SDR family NAD(P)-dependent oxidoreductase [Paracoccus aerodenitrificans]